MDKPRSIVMRSKSDDTGRNIQSRIARYIRGEISANMIVSTNSSKADLSEQAAISAASSRVPTVTQAGRRGLFGAASKVRHKTRPPFRNTVNVKNTHYSFLAMVPDMKEMSVTADEPVVREIDIDTICLCQSEAIRKFVPEPGSYMSSLTRKLTALQNRHSSD